MSDDNNTDAAPEVGDIVMLKSGGPMMTVVLVSGNYSKVAYFSDSHRRNDELRYESFPNACLDVVDIGSGGTDDDGQRADARGGVINLDLRAANGDVHSIGRGAAVA